MWNLAGRPSGKYPAATKGDLVIPKLAQHGGLDLKRLSDHARASLQGEVVHTLTVTTDVFTGWTESMALKNGAHRWVIEAMTVNEARLPFPLVGLDTDNGGELAATR